MTLTVSPNDEPTYGIGAVSRLTGIPLDTLRVWERRYSLVTPLRTLDNKRQYTRTDVARLKLIKQLVDEGHAISSVAHLSGQALQERRQIHLEEISRPIPAGKPMRALAYGDALPFMLEEWSNDMGFLELVGSHRAFSNFENDAMTLKPELLLVELPVVRQEWVGQLRELISRSGAKRTVVVYTFGMKALLDELTKQGVFTLRAPATPRALEQVCRADAGNQSAIRPVLSEKIDAQENLPPRRFDSETLATIANISTNIRCECPHHLADLLFRLTAFEAYSADCENRNEQDAVLHAHLHQATARARAIVEEALDYLIQCEKIELDPE